jgi:TolA-binding protein
MHATRLARSVRAAAVVLAFFLGAALVPPAAPQTTPGLAGLLAELWAKLRAAAPRSPSAPTAVSMTVTAGVRGAEATESELKPYWKGDREQDPAYRAERQALQAAQTLADAGRYGEAARAFDGFLSTHPASLFGPNARFGAGLAHAAAGDKRRAIDAFEAFLKQDAQHALARDAERILGALR